MAPSAPGLVSTTTGWPSACESGVVKMRAPTSAAPPGGKGTTRRIGLSGYWALTEKATNAAAAKATRRIGSLLKAVHKSTQLASERAIGRSELLQDGEVVVAGQAQQLRLLDLLRVLLRLPAQLG